MAFLVQSAAAPVVSSSISTGNAKRTYQAYVSGTGAVSATVDIEVSNNNLDFLVLGTMTMSGTTRATDGFVADAPWAFARANVRDVSGTGAQVSVETEA